MVLYRVLRSLIFFACIPYLDGDFFQIAISITEYETEQIEVVRDLHLSIRDGRRKVDNGVSLESILLCQNTTIG